MVKKHKTQHHSQPAHHAASPKREMVATIVMTAVITAAILIAGFIIFNALKEGSWSMPNNTGNTPGGDGTVTMYEYSDFECPFCGRAYPTVKQLKAQYGDQLVVVFKHFPLSFHPNAQKASEASECARDQNKFDEYHDVLFENQDALTVTSLKKYARDLNLDADQFNLCLDSGEKTALVKADMAEGQKLGVTGTPTFVINGESIVGAQPITAFQTIIDKALGGTPSDTPAPTVNDPIVTLTVITDPTCASCDHQQIMDITKQQLFPSAQIVTLDKDDNAAKKLISELKLTALPAYLFSANIKDAASFSRVEGAMTKVGDYYMINAGAAGPVRYLALPSIDGKEIKGNANAPVTIIEFSDFECPFCKRFADDVMPTVQKDYIDTGKVKMVFMQLPLEQIHPNARGAALASECAAEQEMFWVYHDELFKDQSKLSISDLKAAAVTVGLDTAQFNTCLDTERYDALVDAELQTAQTYGISGTPGFLINGVFVGGLLPVDGFTEIIDNELAATN